MSGSRDEGWHVRVMRVLRIWTAMVQLSWAMALSFAVEPWVGWLGSLGIGLSAWLLPMWSLKPLVFDTLPDHPRPAWRVNGLERSFFVHWLASHVTPVGWVIAGMMWVTGQTPIPASWWVLGFYLCAMLIFAWGIYVTPRWLRIRELDVPVADLPDALEGIRILHLSDLHIGSFTPPAVARRWVSSVMRQDADFVVITGDFVTSGVLFHEKIADVVAALSERWDVFCVAGNHDYFGDGEPLFGELERHGVKLLRNEHVVIERQGASLILAGVEDTWVGRCDLAAALSSRPKGTTLLLAHDPSAFDEAVQRGVSLVLSGHTHGGQIAVPGLARHLNLTRLSNRYSLGVYRREGSTLVVSGGLGVTGVPARIGVRPEVLLLRLRRARP